MISIQAFRISVGLFQFKLLNSKPKNSTYRDRNGGSKCSLNLKILLIFFLLGVNVNNTFSKVSQVANNRINHMLNGNISKKGNLTLFTWNKGNSTFKNKRDDILITIERYKPDIFAIHEANFDINNDRGFENYTIEANTLCRGHQISRTIILIKKGVAYKRRKDLENDYIASVWVQITIS